ncbi:MAG: hypothetical protein WBP12_02170 [Candidatus Saccharimonas sp.]
MLINLVELPTAVNPKDIRTYFPSQEGLVQWVDAHTNVPGKNRQEIPVGTRLAVLVEVELDGDGYCLKVANSSHGADLFRPILEPKGKNLLADSLGVVVAAMLTVGERTGDFSCHGGSYAVSSDILLAVLPINPTDFQLATMRPGAHFMLQGKFVHYYEVTPGQMTPDTKNHKTRGRIVIEMPNGIRTTIDSFRPHMKEPTYDDGVIENLRYERMIPGETIRIAGFISEGGSLSDVPKGTPTVGYNQPYLLIPDAGRLSAYDSLRDYVEQRITDMRALAEVQAWADAREIFADLRKVKLTRHEAGEIRAIMESVPAEHRSVYYTRQYGADEIEQAFGIDPETLNRTDFLAYAREILVGDRQNPTDKDRRADQSYLFRFWGTKHCILTSTDLADILLAAISVRFDSLENASDKEKQYRDDLGVLRNCVNYIAKYGRKDEDIDPRLVHMLVVLVTTCVQKGYFPQSADAEGKCPERFQDVLWDCCRVLAVTYMNQPIVREIITPSLVGGWMGHLVSAGADTYVIEDLRKVVPRR